MHAKEHSVITLIVKTDRFIFSCRVCFSIEQKTLASLINKTNVVFHVVYTYLSNEELIPANMSQKLYNMFLLWIVSNIYRIWLRTTRHKTDISDNRVKFVHTN